MKGLIYKDLCTQKKLIVSSFLTFICLSVLGILIIMSTKIGNFADIAMFSDHNSTGYKGLVILAEYLPVYGMMTMITTIVCQSIGDDLASGWSAYMITSPVSEKKEAGALYILIISCSAVSVISGMLNVLIVSIITGTKVGIHLVFNFEVILLLITFIMVYQTVIFLFFRNKAAETIAEIALVILVGVIFYLSMKNIMPSGENPSENSKVLFRSLYQIYKDIRAILAPIFPLIYAAELFIGYKLTVMMLRRRGK